MGKWFNWGGGNNDDDNNKKDEEQPKQPEKNSKDEGIGDYAEFLLHPDLEKIWKEPAGNYRIHLCQTKMTKMIRTKGKRVGSGNLCIV